MTIATKIDNNYKIKISSLIIEKAGLKPGMDIIWVYDENSGLITLSSNNSSDGFSREDKPYKKYIGKLDDNSFELNKILFY